MKHIVAILAFGIGFSIAKMDAYAQSGKPKSISAKQLSKKIQKGEATNIIDLRTHDELIGGKITDAMHLDYYADDFKQKLSALDKSQTYYVYCHSGKRSGDTAKIMAEMGFTEVYDLKGGIVAWKSLGKPIKRLEQ